MQRICVLDKFNQIDLSNIRSFFCKMVECVFRQESILQTIFWCAELEDILSFIKISFDVFEVCSTSNSIKRCIQSKLTDKWIQTHSSFERAFITSIYDEHFEIFCELIKRGATANYSHQEPIIAACAQGLDRFVKVLLSLDYVYPCAKSNLALLLAIQSGHVGVVKQLLSDPRVDPLDRGGACLKVLNRIQNPNMLKVFSDFLCPKNDSH